MFRFVDLLLLIVNRACKLFCCIILQMELRTLNSLVWKENKIFMSRLCARCMQNWLLCRVV